MSQVVESPATAVEQPVTDPAVVMQRPPQPGKVIIWAIAASLLLVGSSVVRSIQATIYDEGSLTSLEAPFPLSQIPKSFDGWHLVEGSETVLDPMTTRITGSTDHIIGEYVDEQTGVKLLVMALYGPAEPVVPHIPEVCFPATGFKAVGVPTDRDIAISDHAKAKFRSTVFAKSGGRVVMQEAVYYSFRHNGVWAPWVNTSNSARKNPGIFKIQIQRRTLPGEAQAGDEPIESFISKMIPAFEAAIDQSLRRNPAGAKAS